ncbi:hypothetical protein JCM10450v2_003646 [Rhodotorula kratochvilovae]
MRPPTPDPAPPLAAPNLLAVFQTALKPIQTRLNALEARLPLQNRFSALPIEGDDVAPSNEDDAAERSYANATAFPALQHSLSTPSARASPLAPPPPSANAVVLRNPDNNTPQSLVSSLALPSNTTTSRLPSGDVLLRLENEKQAAHLCCTALTAGLSVATPVARHGALVHWVPKVEGVEEELRAALEARGEGEKVVRELRWLGEGKGRVGSMMAVLWNPERVSELVGGNGELWLGQQYRLSCERARGRKGRTHPEMGVLPPAWANAGGTQGVQGAPQRAQEGGEQRARRAREEGGKSSVDGEEAVQAAATTPAGSAGAGSAQGDCKGPEGDPAARAANAQAAECETSETKEDKGDLANLAKSLAAVVEVPTARSITLARSPTPIASPAQLVSPDYTPIRPARTPSPPNTAFEEVDEEEVDISTAIPAEEARQKVSHPMEAARPHHETSDAHASEEENAPAGLHFSLRTSPSPVAASPAPSDMLLVTPSTTGGTSAMSLASASPVSPLAARDLAHSRPMSPSSDNDSTVTPAPSMPSASASSAESGGYVDEESEANVSWSDEMDLVAPLAPPPPSQRPRAAVVAAPRRAMRARRIAACEEWGSRVRAHNLTLERDLPPAPAAAPPNSLVVVAGDFNLSHPSWDDQCVSPTEQEEDAALTFAAAGLDHLLPHSTPTWFPAGRQGGRPKPLELVLGPTTDPYGWCSTSRRPPAATLPVPLSAAPTRCATRRV